MICLESVIVIIFYLYHVTSLLNLVSETNVTVSSRLIEITGVLMHKSADNEATQLEVNWSIKGFYIIKAICDLVHLSADWYPWYPATAPLNLCKVLWLLGLFTLRLIHCKLPDAKSLHIAFDSWHSRDPSCGFSCIDVHTLKDYSFQWILFLYLLNFQGVFSSLLLTYF